MKKFQQLCEKIIGFLFWVGFLSFNILRGVKRLLSSKIQSIRINQNIITCIIDDVEFKLRTSHFFAIYKNKLWIDHCPLFNPILQNFVQIYAEEGNFLCSNDQKDAFQNPLIGIDLPYCLENYLQIDFENILDKYLTKRKTSCIEKNYILHDIGLIARDLIEKFSKSDDIFALQITSHFKIDLQNGFYLYS